MASFYTFECNKCKHRVNTSGPHEFYRNKKGNMKPYGHPVPISKEAAEMGISGLTIEFYCPKCDKNFETIIVEYKKPTDDKLAMWSGALEPKDEYKNKDVFRCPKCDEILIFNPEEFKNIKCSRCKEGIFIFDEKMFIIS